MSNECKLAPGIWHPISAINDTNRYEPSFLLHCPDLICSDFNPSGVVEGHWCDDEGWQAAVWCGYHDEFHTKFVTPTLVMTIPSIVAPQPPALKECGACSGCEGACRLDAESPPALGGEPVEPWYYYADCADPDYSCLCNNEADALTEVADHGGSVVKLWNVAPDHHLAPLQAELTRMNTQFDELAAAVGFTKGRCEQTGDSPLDCAHRLQAEIDRLKEESFEGLYNAAIDERDQLKARCDELEALLLLIRDQPALNPIHRARIKTILSKPAGSEQV